MVMVVKLEGEEEGERVRVIGGGTPTMELLMVGLSQ